MIHMEIDMNAETITAICSIVIAVLAFVVAAYQVIVGRKHNRLSVRPSLVFYRNIVKLQPRVQIVLRNAGIGPAFTKNFRVTLDGSPVRVTTPLEWWRVATKLGIPVDESIGIVIDRQGAISPNEELTLLAISTPEKPEVALKAVERLDIHVDYESAYGEKGYVRLNSDLT